MRNLILLLLCLLPGPTTFAGGVLTVTQEQVTFLEAKSAIVVEESEDRTLILASDLSNELRYGVLLKIENQEANWIEVHPADNPFPPKVQGEFQPGMYLIEGDPGDTFYVSIRSKEAPIWLTIQIAPQGPRPPPDQPVPDPEPPTDDLVQLSERLSRVLNDPPTASSLAIAINETAVRLKAMCDAGQCPALSGAKQMMVSAIEGTLLLRTGDSRNADWLGGWRRPINDALTHSPATTVEAYRQQMLALAAGLEQSVR